MVILLPVSEINEMMWPISGSHPRDLHHEFISVDITTQEIYRCCIEVEHLHHKKKMTITTVVNGHVDGPLRSTEDQCFAIDWAMSYGHLQLLFMDCVT